VPAGEAPIPLIADRAYDSDKLRTSLWAKGWDLVCPHRRGRRRPNTQDGRKLRRYRRRWKIERTIAWLGSYRRLVVRYERYSFIYQGFIHFDHLP
jgi:transposase